MPRASFESKSQPIRNICTNPKLTVNNSGYSYGGLQAVSMTRQAVTDIPGISWEWRGVATATASGTRLIFQMNNLVVGTAYTFGFWAKRIGQSAYVIVAEDLNTLNPQVNLVPGAVGIGFEWLSGQFIATTTSMSLQLRQQGATTGDIEYSMTGVILVETASLAGRTLRYYDGDSYGWKWEGTTGISTSVGYLESPSLIRNLLKNPGSESVALQGEGSGGGAQTRDTSRYLFGSASTKFVWSSGTRGVSITKNPDSTVPAAKPSQKYAIAFWVYVESGTPPQFLVTNQNYATIAPAITGGEVGKWVRYSATFTTQNTTNRLRVYDLSGSPTTYYVDGAILVEGDVIPEAYSDGDTPGWRWEGTAGASTSVGYPDPPSLIRNRVTEPIPYASGSLLTNYGGAGVTGAVFTAPYSTADGPLGRPYARLTAGTGGGGQLTIGNHGGGATGTGNRVVPGEVLWVSGWGRMNSARPLRCQVTCRNAAGGVITELAGSDTVLAPNTWTRVSAQVTIPANTVYVEVRIGSYATTNSSDVLDVTMFMLSTALTEYSDGDTPGWRWEGATRASRSAGLPYTLQSIAGNSPSFEAFDTSTSISINRTFPIGISGYTVFDYVTGAQVNNNVRDASSTQQFAWLTTSGRVQGLDGTMRTLTTGTPSIGRHVGTLAWSADRTQFSTHLDAAADVTATITNPGTQYLPTVYGRSALNGGALIYGAIFDGEHNRETRLAVNRWLANKYGFILTT